MWELERSAAANGILGIIQIVNKIRATHNINTPPVLLPSSLAPSPPTPPLVSAVAGIPSPPGPLFPASLHLVYASSPNNHNNNRKKKQQPTMQQVYQKDEVMLGFLKDCIAGTLGGVACLYSGHPFDTCKVPCCSIHGCVCLMHHPPAINNSVAFTTATQNYPLFNQINMVHGVCVANKR